MGYRLRFIGYGLQVIGMLCLAVSMHASVVTYTADNTTVFKNPERGFTEELSSVVSVSSPNVVKGEIDENWGAEYKMCLVKVLYNFKQYKSADLPEAVLDGFDEDMQELRKYGLKCVLRFAYTEKESDKNDATPEWVKRHLEQLKPHLAANADVVYALEAGFVGVWGEWYYTNNYGNKSQHMNENRRKVIQYLYDNVPEEWFILFRYPLLKIEYFGDEIPMTEAEAFTGTMRARWGCHNDAFLNSYGNDGTYGRDDDEMDDDPALRAYIAQESLYVPNGGETNVESNSLAKKVYADAPAEMSTYHWSFCGSSYAEAVTDRWRSSGLFDTLNIHMGYRYNLLDAQFSDEAAPGGKMNVMIRLRNVGYAPLYNARPVYVVLKGVQNTEYRILIESDPRRWLPNGEVSVINEQVDIPSNLPEGTYHLYLWLPDRHASIQDDPRYAVRLANEDVWDGETGYNDLKTTVTITETAPMDIELMGDGLQITEPMKILDKGQFYILMPNGKKYYCF